MIAIQVLVLAMLVTVQGLMLRMPTPAPGVIVPTSGAVPQLPHAHTPPGPSAISGAGQTPPGGSAVLGSSVVRPKTNPAPPAQPATTPGVPALIPNNCSVEVPAGVNCTWFGQQMCAPGTRYDTSLCVCNFAKLVNTLSCSSVNPFVPNNCGVEVPVAGGCKEFGSQLCPAGLLFDISLCRCDYNYLVDVATCSLIIP